MSRGASVEAHEVASTAVRPETMRLACRSLAELLEGLEVRRWPRLRWMRRSGFSGLVRDFPPSANRDLWLDADLTDSELIATVGHEVRHVAQLEAGHRDRGVMEADAHLFSRVVEQRHRAGLALVPALVPPPVVQRSAVPPAPRPAPPSSRPASSPQRPPLPTTTRQATGLRPGPIRHAAPQPGMRHEVWLHDGRKVVTCRSCFLPVAINTRHSCRG